MKQNMPTPAYAPQQTAYIQPCAGQLSYKSLLVKKNSAQMDSSGTTDPLQHLGLAEFPAQLVGPPSISSMEQRHKEMKCI